MKAINELPLDIIKKWSQDPNPKVSVRAMEALRSKKNINSATNELVEQRLYDSDIDVVASALWATSTGREIPFNIIEQHLLSCTNFYNSNGWPLLGAGNSNFICAAEHACDYRIMPLDLLEKWLTYAVNSIPFEQAIINNLETTDYEIPSDIINNWLNGNVLRKKAAIHYLKTRNKPMPKIRTIEPPDKVYKACLGGVIVVAHIPEDAQIRGNIKDKCRTNKAIITDIIGEFGGEKIGISIWNGWNCYCIGDKIEIEDFDYTFEECSTGFHFFCSLEAARNYGAYC